VIGRNMPTLRLAGFTKTWENIWRRISNPSMVDRGVTAHSESRLFPLGRCLGKMKATKVALFTSSWWPYASFDTLRIATYLSIWVSIHYPSPKS
jgi:hypothetical protein